MRELIICTWNLTVRPYVCVCRARQEPSCPYHCAKRHLERLRLAGVETSAENYLFPGQDGQPMRKFQVVQLIEPVLQAAGVDTTRVAKRDDRSRASAVTRSQRDPVSSGFERAAGTIQLQGRWCSRSIDRYVQLASLLSLPQNVRAATAVGSLPAPTTSLPTAVMILSDAGHRHRQLGAEPDPDGILPLLDAPAPAASTTGITMDQVWAEIAKAIPPVRENLTVQPRRRVAHAIGVPEAQNEVHCWRTTCGWGYGWSSYYRAQADSLGPELRRRRCFPEAGCPSSSSSTSSSSSGS